MLLGEDGATILGVDAQFELGDLPSGLRFGEELSVATPLPLGNAAIPQPGSYSFELLIDGVHQASIPFTAALVEASLPLEEGTDEFPGS